MVWKYADLSAAEQGKIALALPQDWSFGGEPGGRIWPVFVCPVCADECDEEWGGCAHFKYIYDRTAGCYACFSGTFFYELAAKLDAMGHVETAAAIEDQVNADRLLCNPDNIAAAGEPPIGIKDVYPGLTVREFRVSNSEETWLLEAVFLP